MSESRIQARGLFSNLPTGSRNIVTDEVVNLDPPFGVLQTNLLIGDNTVSLPLKTKAVLINFDPTSVTTKKLKGVNGDTGITLGTIGWVFFPIVIGSSSFFVINCSATEADKNTEVVFF
jgi:hypothetical protein